MYEKKTIEETLQKLNADGKEGLKGSDVEERQRHYGRNVLEEKKQRTLLQRFVGQLCDSLIFVLFAAAGISVLLGEYSDAVIILTVVALNAAVGVVQEGKAQKALEALRKMTRLEAVVIRDGVEQEIDAQELVPGDLVVLDAGCQVPADMRLIQSAGLKIEESALTGESAPVKKEAGYTAEGKVAAGDRKNMAFMTSYVTSGRGRGIVTATGMGTEIGRIAAMIHEAPEEETPLQKRLGELGKILSLTAVALCAALFVLAVIQKRDVMEMLITAISLAVAAVPEGLPAVVTIVLALSVTRMAKAGTIVRKLPSVETLGAVSVVCTDKTGTLTKNQMTVTEWYENGSVCEVSENGTDHSPGLPSERLAECFALCSDAVLESRTGDPTELALQEFALLAGVSRESANARKKRCGEIPFDSERRMMTTLHREKGGYVSYTKGAPDEVIKHCTKIWKNGEAVPMTPADQKQVRQAAEEMSGKALRVLAAAMREGVSRPAEKGLTFIGMAGMMDPPRDEAREAVELFKKASVRTVMITGDHAKTAGAIARQLGIAGSGEECMTGEELDRTDDETLRKRIGTLSVFARVSPEHKVRIVNAFRSAGMITAMTGDGVNDAPSLKNADIGIAMGRSGTDVAKQAADMILTDDNFATIEKAIEEGRGIYENIKKSVIFLLSSNFGEIATMFAAIAAGVASPLKPSHILWINLITDSLPALALGVDQNDNRRLMRRPPRKAGESLFAGGGWFYTLFYGFLIAGISLAAFFRLPVEMAAAAGMELSLEAVREMLQNPEILLHSQTYAFTVLGLSQLFHAVGMRDVRASVFGSRLFSNRLMLLAFGAGLMLQAAVTEVPFLAEVFGTSILSISEWGFLLSLAAVPLIAHEILAIITARKER